MLGTRRQPAPIYHVHGHLGRPAGAAAWSRDHLVRLPPLLSAYRYITVDEEAGRALFYTFVESRSKPASDPLVLWLNGCGGGGNDSSLASQALRKHCLQLAEGPHSLIPGIVQGPGVLLNGRWLPC